MQPEDYLPYLKPYEDPYRCLTKKQARECHEHLMSAIPERLAIISDMYLHSTGIELTIETCRVSDLRGLTQWLFDEIEIRWTNELGIIVHLNRLPEELDRRDWTIRYDIDGLALGKAFDVGLFVCELYRRVYPELFWDLVTKPKNDVDFQRSVLASPYTFLSLEAWNITTNLMHGWINWKPHYWDDLWLRWEQDLLNLDEHAVWVDGVLKPRESLKRTQSASGTIGTRNPDA